MPIDRWYPVFVLLLATGLRAEGRDEAFRRLHQLPAATSWSIESMPYRTRCGKEAAIRTGHLPADSAVPFRGNVLYYQGFADSMLNHDPLFRALSDAGFRVIGFDYPGQGGSGGSMNDIAFDEIAIIGNRVRERHADPSGPGSLRIALGWSTGGLAAYHAACQGEVDKLVMIAPGIHVRALVGRFGKVTLSTLTSRPAGESDDPHLDPIRSASPLLVPIFATRLLAASIQSHRMSLPPTVPGLALLTGEKDRYVKAVPTARTLQRNAPHLKIVTFAGSLLEVDNEVDSIRIPAQEAILEFLIGEKVP